MNQSEQSFIARLRNELANQIESEKSALVRRTTERAAGKIEGMEGSLRLIDTIIQDMTGKDRARAQEQ